MPEMEVKKPLKELAMINGLATNVSLLKIEDI
jgi:hypothetical protein